MRLSIFREEGIRVLSSAEGTIVRKEQKGAKKIPNFPYL